MWPRYVVTVHMVHIFHCISLGLVHLCKGPCEGSLMEGVISKGAYNWDKKSALKEATV